MVIVNGTFNTDLSGWTPYTSGNADVIWDNGRARIRTYQCAYASLSQTFVVDKPGLKYDWIFSHDLCPERPAVIIIIDGVEIYHYESFGLWPAWCEFGVTYSGTELVDLSPYVGKTATIQIEIHGYPGYCWIEDHANAYFWVDNIMTEGTATGSISFTSTPSGADIYIDEMYQGLITPAVITGLSIGEHVYRLSLAGYYDQIGSETISGGVITKVYKDFSSKATTDCQEFNTVPHGSRVYIDGYDMRVVSPVKVCGIPLGIHTYRLAGTFTVEKDKGCEFFLSVPKDARVIIDGIDQGIMTPGKVCYIPLGIHTYILDGTFLVSNV